ncbi:probable ATP-dependent RNA helicase DDX10 [Anabrus simplex]|uniref:probable ATP-dependent RNA helicase DDX10 n=1 Tax=Anabrus simplex TaxID=316456 RepID=UPI0035A2963E
MHGTKGSERGKKTGKSSKRKVKIYKNKKKERDELTEIQELQKSYENVDSSNIASFQDLPLSRRTLKGLSENGFTVPTEIQRESICLGLRGLDILGAAKTGSGKTLAFLIPVLELLYCRQWTRLDGTGALIITPTRELAYQIFETLRKVGQYHDFSAGLIIGGKDLHFEKKRMDQCNIVICTPGRLLQHMDENPLFNCSSMQILVLDEADRCLDLGFEKTMNSIIENLPPKRQTLLFSATQTKSVRDLARLSLKDPMYVSVHEHAKHSTPESLQQSYIVCELHEKMSMLWSFIKNHQKQKILVFMASCKQVKYHYEVFCRLRPGISLLALYGTLHQLRRMSIYESFCRKSSAVLFATDIAARGLDFPEVNWVVQLDCPEDANTYIHRAGRTARYHRGGESLLVLLPSEEEAMVKELENKKIPIKRIRINPNKLQTPQRKMEALVARDSNLKESAQRAFVSYLKSVFLMKNKDVFNVHALNTDAYSSSLGLAVPPRIRFLQKLQKNQQQNVKNNEIKEDNNKDLIAALKSRKENDSEELSSEEEEEESVTKSVPPEHKKQQQQKILNFGLTGSDSEEDDILQIKRKDHDLEGELEVPDSAPGLEKMSKKKNKIVTKAAIAKKILKKKIVANKKTVFDEEGEAVLNKTKERVSELAKEYETEDVGGIDIEKAKLVLREEDKFDKQLFRERVKAKHREKKRKLKKPKEEEDEEEEDKEGDSGGDWEGEDSDSGPDLSWLPDPDKVYKQDGSVSGPSDYSEQSDSESQADSGSQSEDPIHRPIPLKRKLSDGKKNTQKKRRLGDEDESDDDKPLDTGLSLPEDEELALQFLQSGR